MAANIGLAAEGAGVFRVLRNFHLLHLFSQGSTIAVQYFVSSGVALAIQSFCDWRVCVCDWMFNCRAGPGLIACAIFNASSKGIDVLLRPAFKMSKHTHKNRARNVVVRSRLECVVGSHGCLEGKLRDRNLPGTVFTAADNVSICT